MVQRFIELTLKTGMKCIINISQIKGVYYSAKYESIIDLGHDSEYIVKESYKDIIAAIQETCTITKLKTN